MPYSGDKQTAVSLDLCGSPSHNQSTSLPNFILQALTNHGFSARIHDEPSSACTDCIALYYAGAPHIRCITDFTMGLNR